MKEGLVSIIIPVYNAEDFLTETIESVQAQTYEYWELLLVDDCSSDSSGQIIEKKAKEDDRIKYIKLEKNSGAAVTRNIGLSEASGRYVAFLDSDDIWKPEKLERQMDFLAEKKVAFCFTSYRYTNTDGSPTPKVARAPEKIDYNGLLNYYRLFHCTN